MCGIAGVINKKKTVNVGEQMRLMLQGIKHRGPDSTGYAMYGKPKKDGFILIDANSNKFKIGNPSREDPIILKILDKHPSWSAKVYGDEPREKLIFKHKNLKILGFKDNKFILNDLKKISISVICSRWDEPFGRTSLEAASRGSAVIISNRGGLPETAPHAIKLKKLEHMNLKSLQEDEN